MIRRTRLVTHALMAAGVLLIASCGKSGDENQKAAGDESGAAPVPVAVVTDAPMKAELEAAGYKPVSFKPFPSQVPGLDAYVVVYRGDRGDGGVLYLQEHGDGHRPLWHWYFDQGAPDSVQAVEINEDGLWDVRMFAGGDTYDYVQDQSFTLVARQRDDAVAMNGSSSEPVDAGGMIWHAFDGDTTTAWRSKAGGAYIDLPVPLGVDAGILTIQLAAEDQPRKVEVKADGKTVQTLELDETTLQQSIQLDPAARSADVVRLEFKSAHRGASNVAVAEVGLK